MDSMYHAKTCTGACRTDPVPHPLTIQMHHNDAKLEYYFATLRDSRTSHKGVFYPRFTEYACMWCHSRTVRRIMYAILETPYVDETHLCPDRRLIWYKERVESGSICTQAELMQTGQEYYADYFRDASWNEDHVNTEFAYCTLMTQMVMICYRRQSRHIASDYMEILSHFMNSSVFKKNRSM